MDIKSALLAATASVVFFSSITPAYCQIEASHEKELVCNILRSWEARFNQAKIDYETSNEQGIKYTCSYVSFPGFNRLIQNSDYGSEMTSIEYGRVWRTSTIPGTHLPFYTVYGSKCANDVNSYKSIAMKILYASNVLINEAYPFSKAVQNAENFSFSDNKNGRIYASFKSPEDSKVSADIELEIDTKHRIPISITRVKHTLSIRNTIHSGSSTDPFCYKVNSSLLINKKWYLSNTYEVKEIKPLIEPPSLYIPPANAIITDESVGYTYRISDIGPLDKIKTKAVEENIANLKQHTSGATTYKRPICGPDSLYYLLSAAKNNVDPTVLYLKFNQPEMGTSLTEIYEVAKQYANVNVSKSSDMNLENIKLPALLAVRPSHFIVMLALKNNQAFILNPPYETRWESLKNIRNTWTGFSLQVVGK